MPKPFHIYLLQRSGLLVALAAIFSLSACSISPRVSEKHQLTEEHFSIGAGATILSANYGSSYLLSGNIIARYPDFDLMRVHSQTVPNGYTKKKAGNYSTFVLRNRKGQLLKKILLSPHRQGELMRFTINGRSYHISHGNQTGAVVISIPSHQLA